MTRVSLREAYDNKDVVAQIYAIRDTAESAVDTSEQAVTTANTASDHVDALIPQVEGAVANANSASASAQTSAQTVAGYENRLANVEDNVEDLAGDLNAVTLRVQTAEGNIVTIQGRVTALETADGQNVKINNINNYAVGLTGNQTVAGEKTHTNVLPISIFDYGCGLRLIRRNLDVTQPNVRAGTYIESVDGNGQPVMQIIPSTLGNGKTKVDLLVRNTDGTMKTVELARGD